ncbi:hypothetical protein HYALB_00010453 [Hymenoscyphus albidus]|uniref:Uncharacterized protein n=1 Tax=Hymenoscyphus albidus TaxID=595503 RepID=A0A9N9LIP0_9HELO|nr:hypothetical protein HYALB_00010453 [Hymenoscyphus albidus]
MFEKRLFKLRKIPFKSPISLMQEFDNLLLSADNIPSSRQATCTSVNALFARFRFKFLNLPLLLLDLLILLKNRVLLLPILGLIRLVSDLEALIGLGHSVLDIGSLGVDFGDAREEYWGFLFGLGFASEDCAYDLSLEVGDDGRIGILFVDYLLQEPGGLDELCVVRCCWGARQSVEVLVLLESAGVSLTFSGVLTFDFKANESLGSGIFVEAFQRLRSIGRSKSPSLKAYDSPVNF